MRVKKNIGLVTRVADSILGSKEIQRTERDRRNGSAGAPATNTYHMHKSIIFVLLIYVFATVIQVKT